MRIGDWCVSAPTGVVIRRCLWSGGLARGALRGLLAVAAACLPATAGEVPEPTRLVDSPTAGLIEKGRFGLNLRLFPRGGVLGQVDAGVLKRLSIGLSYGGVDVIGDDSIDWYPRVEVAARYRVIEESEAMPALTVGYETQGYGVYHNGRYQFKSKGAFAALSKNYTSSIGQFGVHGGVNLSREDDDDNDLSGWVGADKRINEELALVAEYDFALNDNDSDSIGSGKGFLNASVYWAAVPNVSIGLVLKNILQNGAEDDLFGGPDPDMTREISIRYTEEF